MEFVLILIVIAAIGFFLFSRQSKATKAAALANAKADARRVIPANTAYKDVGYKQALALSTSFQSFSNPSIR